ncbi:MAG: hypothetical protein MUO70_10100 [Euryarchaeota archaeon]|nr:hypothetical protein [Euryarchaeota archaeon]
MSAIVVQLIENDYFASNERVEHTSCLGCTEYGLLSTSGMEVGYDRLEDKYCSYLRQDFRAQSMRVPPRELLESRLLALLLQCHELLWSLFLQPLLHAYKIMDAFFNQDNNNDAYCQIKD